MAQVAQKYSSRLADIKKRVREWHDYFAPNYDMFNKTKSFVYKSNLSADETAKLNELGRPVLEFNTLPSYISRLQGEWAQQQPGLYCKPASNEVNRDPRVIEVSRGYTKHVIEEANKKGIQMGIQRDALAGGYGVMKVVVDYRSPHSFEKDFHLEIPYDVTMCGFDPLARLATKADGEFCYEIFPISEEEFKRTYPGVSTANISFAGSMSFGGFSWSYRSNQNRKFLVICEFYEKKYKKTKLLKLADGSTKTQKEYEELIKYYEDNMIIAQVPIPVEQRMVDECIICRYKLIENQVLDYVETDYTDLPLIFVDGDSTLVKDTGYGDGTLQVIRPYVKDAIDAQRLKNLSGQTLANDIECLQQSKIVVAVESIPERDVDAYIYPQRANVYKYHAFNQDGVTPLPPPSTMPRIPTPPEITNTFIGSDEIIQNILGSFNSARAVNDSTLSGKAIVEGASQSNATAMPFINNYLLALAQAGQIIVDMLPIYMDKERDLPIITQDGRQSYAKINSNQPDAIRIKYKRGDYKICVEAGTNYEVQKEKELKLLVMLSQAFPSIAQFINSAGLSIVLDTLNLSGIEQLKEALPKWQQMMEQQAKQGGQQNPEIMKMQMQMQQNQQNNQIKMQEMQMKSQIAKGEMAIDQERLQHEKAKLIFDYLMEQEQAGVQLTKSETERLVHAAELAMNHKDMEHRHAKETLEHFRAEKELDNQSKESIQ